MYKPYCTSRQAWKECGEVKAPYKELKERWSTDDFGGTHGHEARMHSTVI